MHFVVASSLLHRFLTTPPAETHALAEAYYLLGITETYISRKSSLSEAPFFLETSIRLDPTSPIASNAYDVLNLYILTEYTGHWGHVSRQRCRSTWTNCAGCGVASKPLEGTSVIGRGPGRIGVYRGDGWK